MQLLHATSMIKSYSTLAYHLCKVDQQTTLESPYFGSYSGRIFGRNPYKSLKEFPFLLFTGHLYSFGLRFLFLKTHATSYNTVSRALIVHCK
jgi:hypothetical protein